MLGDEWIWKFVADVGDWVAFVGFDVLELRSNIMVCRWLRKKAATLLKFTVERLKRYDTFYKHG